jgi:hypothetical protein
MKIRVLLFTLLIALSSRYPNRITAQQSKPSPALPKYEVGIDFTTLTFDPEDTNVGVGGRFTYNLNRHLALEAAGYFFPGKCATCNGEITGHITEGLFGIKAGQRFKKFGIFGKARPGLISFSKGYTDVFPTGGNISPTGAGTGPYPFAFVEHGHTDFAADLGGVLEIYPKKRFLLRFDAGATFDRVGRQTIHYVNIDPVTFNFTPVTFKSAAYTRRYFQFSAGVGFRF